MRIFNKLIFTNCFGAFGNSCFRFAICLLASLVEKFSWENKKQIEELNYFVLNSNYTGLLVNCCFLQGIHALFYRF